MSKLKLKITEQAQSDIKQVIEYISKDNKKAARETALYLYEICRNLAEFPQMGVSRPDFTNKNYRFFTIKNRYIIVYKIDNEFIYIARLLTNWQDICSLL